MMRIHGRLAVTALAIGFALGCAGQKQAEAALKDAEAAITAQHQDAIRYTPKDFDAVVASYAAARKSYEAKDYAAATRGARATIEQAKQLVPAIAAAKEALAKQWSTTSDDLAFLLKTLEDRVSALSKATRLPASVKRADLAAAKEKLPTLQEGFRKASAAVEQGDLADAMHAAAQIRTQGTDLLQRLGLQTAHPAMR
jgi:hypothetical protein